jgi:hypothetical protein
MLSFTNPEILEKYPNPEKTRILEGEMRKNVNKKKSAIHPLPAPPSGRKWRKMAVVLFNLVQIVFPSGSYL